MSTQTGGNKDQNGSYPDWKTLAAEKHRQKLSETLQYNNQLKAKSDTKTSMLCLQKTLCSKNARILKVMQRKEQCNIMYTEQSPT